MVVCMCVHAAPSDDADVILMVRPHERSHLTTEALQAHARAMEMDDDGDAVQLADLPRTPSGTPCFVSKQEGRMHGC